MNVKISKKFRYEQRMEARRNF